MKKLFVLLLLIALLLPVAGQDIIVMRKKPAAGGGSSDLLTGLVSYYPLGEASGTRADSVGTNNLTDNNTVTQATGIIGNAALFTAGNLEWLEKTDNASLDFSTAMTIQVWLYMPTSLCVRCDFISKWGAQSSWFLETVNTTGANLNAFIADTTGDAGGNFCNTTDAAFVADNWYHIVEVYDGSLTGNTNRLKLYINGTQKTLTCTGTIAASIPNSTASLLVGGTAGAASPHNYTTGRIDEVALWNVALTSGQITRLYNAGAGCANPFSGCP